MYCSKCGASNIDDAGFCGHCGAPLLVASQTVASPPAGPAQAPPAPVSATPSSSTVSKGRRNIAIIAVVVVVVCALIAVVALVGLGNGDLSGIKNGEYMSYDLIATTSGQTMTGTMRMDVSGVTSSSMTVKYTITINGDTTTQTATLSYSGDSWSTAQLVESSGASPTYLGQETISTVYGTMTVYHYSTQYSTYSYEYWSGANGCPYKLVYNYNTNGMTLTCTLHDTNIKDFKS